VAVLRPLDDGSRRRLHSARAHTHKIDSAQRSLQQVHSVLNASIGNTPLHRTLTSRSHEHRFHG
jgi:hypothetical protein